MLFVVLFLLLLRLGLLFRSLCLVVLLLGCFGLLFELDCLPSRLLRFRLFGLVFRRKGCILGSLLPCLFLLLIQLLFRLFLLLFDLLGIFEIGLLSSLGLLVFLRRFVRMLVRLLRKR
jgi:hypothetical protein